MIIVCFIYFDNSLFAGLIFGRYGYISNVKTSLFSNVRMKKSQFQVGKNHFLSSELCLNLFVYLFPFTFRPTVGISGVPLRCNPRLADNPRKELS